MELMVPGDFFFSLMMLTIVFCVLHVLRHFVHWNCCVEGMSLHLALLESERSVERKLHFHTFNSWKLTEASHESFLSISTTLEFEGSIARKLCFHIFNSWNSTEASHESFVFTNHRCDLNVRICTKPCVFLR